jgi:putative membrane protein
VERTVMMGWYHDGIGWSGWLLMTVAMVAFWALVVLGVLALFRSDGSGSGPKGRSPEELLDERFARGELTEQEYRSSCATLHDARRGARRNVHRQRPVVHP